MTDATEELFFVVVNHEEQYSLWSQGRELPPGWKSVGEARPRQACLEEIERVWTDMRPLSLRESLARRGQS